MVVVEVLRGVLLPVLLLLMVVRARVVRGVHLSRSLLLILPRVRMPLHVGIRVLLHVLLLLLAVSVVPGRGVVPRVYVILWGPARGLEHGDVPGIGALRPSSNLRLRRLTPRGLGLSLERGPSRGLASFPRLRLLGTTAGALCCRCRRVGRTIGPRRLRSCLSGLIARDALER